MKLLTPKQQNHLLHEIVSSNLGKKIVSIVRFPTGLSHYVYDIEVAGNGRYVIRLARPERNEQLKRGITWHHKLAALNIPLPHIYHVGEIDNHAFAILQRLPGDDLETIYTTLTNIEKQEIAHTVAAIQQKIHTVDPQTMGMSPLQSWKERLRIILKRSANDIQATGLGETKYIEWMVRQVEQYSDYLNSVTAVTFLYDLNVRNVIINQGKVSGIIDVDDVWVGDPLLAIGRGKTILLTMRQDYSLIDHWCDYLHLTPLQRNMVDFYALLYCIRFMGTTGLALNGNHSPQTDPAILPLLSQLADQLITKISTAT